MQIYLDCYQANDCRVMSANDYLQRRELQEHALDMCGLCLPLIQLAKHHFHKFDHFVKETLRMKEYMRYMDDFFMVAQTKEELEEVLPKINSYINALGLSTHPTKTKIFYQNKKMRVLGFDFHVTKTGKVIMQIDPKNVKDRRKNIYRCA